MTDNTDPTAECRDKIVKRMLATPPQKHAPKGGREPKPAPEDEVGPNSR